MTVLTELPQLNTIMCPLPHHHQGFFDSPFITTLPNLRDPFLDLFVGVYQHFRKERL